MGSKINVSTNKFFEGSIKVAFATDDSKSINAHFGGASQFIVYDIGKVGHEISTIIMIESKDTDKTVSLLAGVDIVYFTQIGPTAAAKVINQGIFPIKNTDVVLIDEEVEKLSAMLSNNPPPFIKKILQKKAAA
jgi:nitrogen fixation protein NifX